MRLMTVITLIFCDAAELSLQFKVKVAKRTYYDVLFCSPGSNIRAGGKCISASNTGGL